MLVFFLMFKVVKKLVSVTVYARICVPFHLST